MMDKLNRFVYIAKVLHGGALPGNYIQKWISMGSVSFNDAVEKVMEELPLGTYLCLVRDGEHGVIHECTAEVGRRVDVRFHRHDVPENNWNYVSSLDSHELKPESD